MQGLFIQATTPHCTFMPLKGANPISCLSISQHWCRVWKVVLMPISISWKIHLTNFNTHFIEESKTHESVSRKNMELWHSNCSRICYETQFQTLTSLSQLCALFTKDCTKNQKIFDTINTFFLQIRRHANHFSLNFINLGSTFRLFKITLNITILV